VVIFNNLPHHNSGIFSFRFKINTFYIEFEFLIQYDRYQAAKTFKKNNLCNDIITAGFWCVSISPDGIFLF
jgi:hypothetical protein